ncbi:hypothetical protein EDEG_01773 [Edhazardia aedis USNM 41457]|uniref:Uncharacterized protein n=1 Tax=Edhazardia aedis (strain USNM 41457) TaxID=1003232 RepID=J9DMZ0_EDHAE|nr:hypothetical protein EDEG_01773 [Edhazardia aedis USNM 41457]|eukprot:EJW03935.1 hypothetical protein EDEG_01773 [Edhazardia aedis USNM 41457]
MFSVFNNTQYIFQLKMIKQLWFIFARIENIFSSDNGEKEDNINNQSVNTSGIDEFHKLFLQTIKNFNFLENVHDIANCAAEDSLNQDISNRTTSPCTTADLERNTKQQYAQKKPEQPKIPQRTVNQIRRFAEKQQDARNNSKEDQDNNMNFLSISCHNKNRENSIQFENFPNQYHQKPDSNFYDKLSSYDVDSHKYETVDFSIVPTKKNLFANLKKFLKNLRCHQNANEELNKIYGKKNGDFNINNSQIGFFHDDESAFAANYDTNAHIKTFSCIGSNCCNHESVFHDVQYCGFPINTENQHTNHNQPQPNQYYNISSHLNNSQVHRKYHLPSNTSTQNSHKKDSSDYFLVVSSDSDSSTQLNSTQRPLRYKFHNQSEKSLFESVKHRPSCFYKKFGTKKSSNIDEKVTSAQRNIDLCNSSDKKSHLIRRKHHSYRENRNHNPNQFLTNNDCSHSVLPQQFAVGNNSNHLNRDVYSNKFVTPYAVTYLRTLEENPNRRF